MNIINKRTKYLSLSVLVMIFWGSLFPFVKLGYDAFRIETGFLPNIILFAGVRFTICGFLITLYGVKKSGVKTIEKSSIIQVLLVGVVAIILHYIFTYVGLTMVDSSKTAVLKQLGVFIFIPFAFLFFREDKFRIKKVIAAALGFLGIVALNTNSSGFNFGIGDLLIVSASLCTVVSNVIGKKVMKKVAPIVVTGYSQLFGGIVLLLLGFLLGGRINYVSPYAVGIFLYICVASILGYSIWNYVVSTNDLSKLFVVKFIEPIFAGFFGMILLGENILTIQYLIAFILILFAIIISNSNKRGEVQNK